MEWPTLGWVDLALVVVLAISALIGTLRGLTFEVLSLAGWIAAWFAGLWLGPLLAPYLPIGNAGSPLNAVISFACAFVVVLIASGLAARGVASLVGRTLLRPLDRLLGAVFVIVRGILLLLVVAVVVAHTPLQASEAWRESIGAQWLNAVVGELVPLVSPRLDTRGGALST